MELPKRIFGAEYISKGGNRRGKPFVIYDEFGTASGAIKNAVKRGGADGARLYIGTVTWTLAAEHGEV